MRQPSTLTLHNIFWWGAFLAAGIWAQTLLPGVDLLLPAILVSMQENRGTQTFWLVVTFTLVQDGTSAMAFGTGFLWYSAIVILFSAGRSVFETENPLFIALLSILMGAWHVGLMIIMGNLQSMELPLARLLTEAALQAAITPVTWTILYRLRGRSRHSVHSS